MSVGDLLVIYGASLVTILRERGDVGAGGLSGTNKPTIHYSPFTIHQ